MPRSLTHRCCCALYVTVQVEELLAIETQLQTKLDEANNELLQTSQGKARVERELKAKCENEVCSQAPPPHHNATLTADVPMRVCVCCAAVIGEADRPGR